MIAWVVAGGRPLVSAVAKAVRLAVAHTTSPYITIYNTSDWSVLPNPSVLPIGAGIAVAFG